MTDASRQQSELEHTLPGSYYFSPDIFEREQERIFYREWFCVGRQETLPEAGDYLHLDVAGQSILLVRNRRSE